MTAEIQLLEGATTLEFISGFFQNMNELIFDGLTVNPYWEGFMDSKIHHHARALMSQRGVNVATTSSDDDLEPEGYDLSVTYHYFYMATQSPDLVKKVFNARHTNPELPNPVKYYVFVTLGPGLENTLEHLVATLVANHSK